MKYILSESQYGRLVESVFPIQIRRRITKENLEKYVLEAEQNNPPICDKYVDGYDYSTSVLDIVNDKVINDADFDWGSDDYIYLDILRHVRVITDNMFGQDLKKLFEDSCPDE